MACKQELRPIEITNQIRIRIRLRIRVRIRIWIDIRINIRIISILLLTAWSAELSESWDFFIATSACFLNFSQFLFLWWFLSLRRVLSLLHCPFFDWKQFNNYHFEWTIFEQQCKFRKYFHRSTQSELRLVGERGHSLEFVQVCHHMGQFKLNGFKQGQTHISQLHISLDPDELESCNFVCS